MYQWGWGGERGESGEYTSGGGEGGGERGESGEWTSGGCYPCPCVYVYVVLMHTVSDPLSHPPSSHPPSSHLHPHTSILTPSILTPSILTPSILTPSTSHLYRQAPYYLGPPLPATCTQVHPQCRESVVSYFPSKSTVHTSPQVTSCFGQCMCAAC